LSAGSRAPLELPVVPVDELCQYVGQEVGMSDWVTIEQHDIDDFARLTRDDQWIHIDRERAARERGGTVAHGFLTLSFLSYLARSLSFRIAGVTHGVNYGFDRLRFTSFVPCGARVRLRQTLKAVEPKAGGMALTRHCVMDIEGSDKPALVADWVTLVYAEAPVATASGDASNRRARAG
jgi:acyl dehydratase